MKEKTTTGSNVFEKTLWHLKNGTLLQTVLNVIGKFFARIRLFLQNMNMRRLNERLIKKYYGGFFEKPRLETAYKEDAAQKYVAEREKTSSWIKENATMHNYLNQLPEKLTVLDVPFGTGRFVEYYREKAFKIYGLEKSESMIEAAKKVLGDGFGGGEVKNGDATNMPYADNSFDLVVSFRFLPHIISFDQAKATIKEIYRVSKKYAIMQIGVRKNEDYRRRMPTDHEKMGTWFYDHEIKDLLLKNGFEIIEKSEALHGGVTINRKYYKNDGAWHAYFCKKITPEHLA